MYIFVYVINNLIVARILKKLSPFLEPDVSSQHLRDLGEQIDVLQKWWEWNATGFLKCLKIGTEVCRKGLSL
jgi:hypothetical protein